MLTVNFNITWKFDTIFDVSTVFTAQVPRWRRNYNKLNNINQSSDCEQSNDCTCEISSRKYEKKEKKNGFTSIDSYVCEKLNVSSSALFRM